jgi:hypothetical protein
MKAVLSELRSLTPRFFIVIAVINIFFILDLTFSSLDGLGHSASHGLPVEPTIFILLWTNMIACVIGLVHTAPLVINWKVSKITVLCFSCMLIIFLTTVVATYDVGYSGQFHKPKSILFNIPAKRSVFIIMALVCIVMQVPFANLYHQIIHTKDAAEENPQPVEEDTNQQ